MKRQLSATDFESLDEINRKLACIKEERHQVYKEVIGAKLEQCRHEAKKFIRDRYPLLLSPDPSQNETTNMGLLAKTAFSEVRISCSIMCHFGPRELYLMSRVAKYFVPIVTDVFCQLSSSYRDLYVKDTVDKLHLTLHEKTKTIYSALTKKYNELEMTTKCGSIGAMLSLWNHYMLTYRPYHKIEMHTSVFTSSSYHIDYVFLYDPKTDTHRRIRDLNLFTITNLFKLEMKLSRQPGLDFYYALEFVDHFVELLDYKGLCEAEMVPITDICRTKDAFMIENNRIISLEDYRLYYVDPAPRTDSFFSFLTLPRTEATKNNMPANRDPFFDYYEQRVNSGLLHGDRKYHTPYRYRLDLPTHVAYLSKKLNNLSKICTS